jgi:hypothetical protein
VDEYYFVGPEGARQRVRDDDACPKQELCVQSIRFGVSPEKATLFFVGRAEHLPRYPRAQGLTNDFRKDGALTKRSITFSAVLVLVLSIGIWLHFYRQEASQIRLLFSGYQLKSIAPIENGEGETNPETLQAVSLGSLQPGHKYVFRKIAKSNDVSFARYRLPIRLWLAHCRVVKSAKPILVFVGQPVFHVEYECGEHRGVISNRLAETPDQSRLEEQLVVTLL